MALDPSVLEAGLPSETSCPAEPSKMWSHACGVQGNLSIGAGEDCPWCGAVASPTSDAIRSASPAPSAVDRGGLVAYLERQWVWSKETFGPAQRTKGIVQHITKELREIEADPHDLSEWVDVIILAMDGFWRHGGNPRDLLPTMQAKQDKNFARQWPDWRAMSEDGAIEHDRSGEAALASRSDGGEGLRTDIKILSGPSTHICWTPDSKPKDQQELVCLVRKVDVDTILVERDRLEGNVLLWRTYAQEGARREDGLRAERARLTAALGEAEAERDTWKRVASTQKSAKEGWQRQAFAQDKEKRAAERRCEEMAGALRHPHYLADFVNLIVKTVEENEPKRKPFAMSKTEWATLRSALGGAILNRLHAAPWYQPRALAHPDPKPRDALSHGGAK